MAIKFYMIVLLGIVIGEISQVSSVKCNHGLRQYHPGQNITKDCNKCYCLQHGDWICTERVCNNTEIKGVQLIPRNDIFVEKGQKLYVVCKSAKEDARFMWFINGIHVKSTSKVALSKYGESILRLSPRDLTRPLTYVTCFVSPSLPQRIKVRMRPAKQLPDGFPRIASKPKVAEVRENHEIKLKCKTAGIKPITVTWFKFRVPISNKDDNAIITKDGTLIIPKAQKSDSGLFECMASNSRGAVMSKQATEIVVNKDVKFKIQATLNFGHHTKEDLKLLNTPAGSCIILYLLKPNSTDTQSAMVQLKQFKSARGQLKVKTIAELDNRPPKGWYNLTIFVNLRWCPKKGDKEIFKNGDLVARKNVYIADKEQLLLVNITMAKVVKPYEDFKIWGKINVYGMKKEDIPERSCLHVGIVPTSGCKSQTNCPHSTLITIKDIQLESPHYVHVKYNLTMKQAAYGSYKIAALVQLGHCNHSLTAYQLLETNYIGKGFQKIDLQKDKFIIKNLHANFEERISQTFSGVINFRPAITTIPSNSCLVVSIWRRTKCHGPWDCQPVQKVKQDSLKMQGSEVKYEIILPQPLDAGGYLIEAFVRFGSCKKNAENDKKLKVGDYKSLKKKSVFVYEGQLAYYHDITVDKVKKEEPKRDLMLFGKVKLHGFDQQKIPSSSCLIVKLEEILNCKESEGCRNNFSAEKRIQGLAFDNKGTLRYQARFRNVFGTVFGVSAILNIGWCKDFVKGSRRTRLGDFRTVFVYPTSVDFNLDGFNVDLVMKNIKPNSAKDNFLFSGKFELDSYAAKDLPQGSCLKAIFATKECSTNEKCKMRPFKRIYFKDVKFDADKRIPFTIFDSKTRSRGQIYLSTILNIGWCAKDLKNSVKSGDFVGDFEIKVIGDLGVLMLTKQKTVRSLEGPFVPSTLQQGKNNFVVVSGNVVLPEKPSNVAKGSCLILTTRDTTQCREGQESCNPAQLTRVVMRNFKITSANRIAYEVILKPRPRNDRYTINAVLNMGWCSEATNRSSWLREGDFFNDAAHEFEIKENGNISKDIDVIKFVKPKNVTDVVQDPCARVECEYYAKCRALPNDSVECFCSQACPLIYKPVCGSDGKGYPNECLMKFTSCFKKELITVAKHGPCEEPTEKPIYDPCAGVECGYYAKCRALPNDSVECFCSQACPLIFKPVCGSDGNDYPNECVMKSASCSKKVLITVTKNGPCEKPTKVPLKEPMKVAKDPLKIEGKVILGESIDNVSNKSCLIINVRESIYCEKSENCPDSTIAEKIIRDITLTTNTEIPYEVEVKPRPKPNRYLISAALNRGWCFNKNKTKTWIKNGDFFNDVEHSFEVDRSGDIYKDIKIRKFTKKEDSKKRNQTKCELKVKEITDTFPVIEGAQIPLVGAYVPQCETDGSFKEVQCHGSTGYCWCVDKEGTKRRETEIRFKKPDCKQVAKDPLKIEGKVILGESIDNVSNKSCLIINVRESIYCDESENCPDSTIAEKIIRDITLTTNTEIPYEVEVKPRPKPNRYLISAVLNRGWCFNKNKTKTWIKNGDFFNDVEHSFEVERSGDIYKDIKIRKFTKKEDSKKRNQTTCELKVEEITDTFPVIEGAQIPLLGAYVPQCETDGSFKEVQCHGSTGYCWCVDKEGTKRKETEIRFKKPDCKQVAKDPLKIEGKVILGESIDNISNKSCLIINVRESIYCDESENCPDSTIAEKIIRDITMTTNTEIPYEVEVKPRPKPNRYLISAALNRGWCFNKNKTKTWIKNGDFFNDVEHSFEVERSGDIYKDIKIRKFTKKEDSKKRNQTKCELKVKEITDTFPVIEGAQIPLVGAYVPQCETDGSFKEVQCHGSTGYCWCVDKEGTKRRETEIRFKKPDCKQVAKDPLKIEGKVILGESIDNVSNKSCLIINVRESIYCDESENCPDSTIAEKIIRDITLTTNTEIPYEVEVKPRPKPNRYLISAVLNRGWCFNKNKTKTWIKNGDFFNDVEHSFEVERSGDIYKDIKIRKFTKKEDSKKRNQTTCELKVEEITDTFPVIEGAQIPLLGAYVPQCETDGSFKEVQCHGSTGYCWCVDKEGTKRKETEIRFKKPDCKQVAKDPLKIEGKVILGESFDKISNKSCLIINVRESIYCDESENCPDSMIAEKIIRDITLTTNTEILYEVEVKPRPKPNRYLISAALNRGWCFNKNKTKTWIKNGDFFNDVEHSFEVERSGDIYKDIKIRKFTKKGDSKKRNQTKCELKIKEITDTFPVIESAQIPLLGAYVPQCERDGSFKEVQCHGSTGYCWCVDTEGTKRKETEIRFKKPDCKQVAKDPLKIEGKVILGESIDNVSNKSCLIINVRESIYCDESENCPDSTIAEKIIRDITLTTNTEILYEVEVKPRPKPNRYLISAALNRGWCFNKNKTKTWIKNGDFFNDVQHSFEVDRSGDIYKDIKIRKFTKKEDIKKRNQTKCELKVKEITDTFPVIEGAQIPLVGAYVPQCETDGSFKEVQCHGSTGYCWCVDKEGTKRRETESRFKKPDCKQVAKDPLKIEGKVILGESIDNVSNKSCLIINVRESIYCDESENCPDSTIAEKIIRDISMTTNTEILYEVEVKPMPKPNRYLISAVLNRGWCFNKNKTKTWIKNGDFFNDVEHSFEVERSGDIYKDIKIRKFTKKGDSKKRNQTKCELKVKEITDTFPVIEGAQIPLLGAYVPQCETDGSFKEVQCHGSTGYCWCVDKEGTKRKETEIRFKKPDCKQVAKDPLKIEGKVILGESIDNISNKSCLIINVRESIYCDESENCPDSTIAEKIIRDITMTTNTEILYEVEVKPRPKPNRYLISAVLNRGWCFNKNKTKTWIKNGDFFNDVEHSFEVERSGDIYKDIKIRKFTKKEDSKKRNQTKCELKVKEITDTFPVIEGAQIPLLGAYLPQCETDGSFKEVQCHGSTGYCWCVDKEGTKRKETEIRFKKPDCKQVAKDPLKIEGKVILGEGIDNISNKSCLIINVRESIYCEKSENCPDSTIAEKIIRDITMTTNTEIPYEVEVKPRPKPNRYLISAALNRGWCFNKNKTKTWIKNGDFFNDVEHSFEVERSGDIYKDIKIRKFTRKEDIKKKKCNEACTREYEPVCGSDRKTYGNLCTMKAKSCVKRLNLTVEHEGECVPEHATIKGKVILSPKHPAIELQNSSCLILTINEAIYCQTVNDCPDTTIARKVLRFPTPMPPVLRFPYEVVVKPRPKPGRYLISGVLNQGWCSDGVNSSKWIKEGDFFNDVESSFELDKSGDIDGQIIMVKKLVKEDDGEKKKCKEACTREYEPVCGSDGKTYGNLCVMEAKSCVKHLNLTVKHEGECVPESATIKGKVILSPKHPAIKLQNSLCLILTINEAIYCHTVNDCPDTTIARKVLRFPTPMPPVLHFPYEVVVKPRPKPGRYLISAVLNQGWCSDGVNSSKWIKEGDFFNDVESSFELDKSRDIDGHIIMVKKLVKEDGKRKKCKEACTREYEPVCGSDGKTYGNLCVMEAKSCVKNLNLTVIHEGKCRDPCKNVTCPFYGVCNVMASKAVCSCVSGCPFILSQVCGSDAVTYDNECLLKVASCKSKKNIVVKHKWACVPDNKDLCQNIKCDFYGQCSAVNGKAKCECKQACPMIFDPVCGSDGKTHANECVMKSQACLSKKMITVVAKGQCIGMLSLDPCEKKECPFNATCILEKEKAICKCPGACTLESKPVCGDDGQTYANECVMRSEACLSNRTIKVEHKGRCKEQSLLINGDILSDKIIPTIPPGSCLTLTIRENIQCFSKENCLIEAKAHFVLKNLRMPGSNRLWYQRIIKPRLKPGRYIIGAVLNRGWCAQDSKNSTWIRDGDFFNDVLHEFEVKEYGDVRKDIVIRRLVLRERNSDFLVVKGDIILDKAERTIPKKSCLSLRIREDVYCRDPLECNIPVTAQYLLRHPIPLNKNKIPFRFIIRPRPRAGRYNINAALNRGWCAKDSNNTEWIRYGDYFNDEAHIIQIEASGSIIVNVTAKQFVQEINNKDCTKDGNEIPHGQVLPRNGNGCSGCKCNDGKISCSPIFCTPAKCFGGHLMINDGDCCPVCVRKVSCRNSMSGQSYDVGQTYFNRNPKYCEICTCNSTGGFLCARKRCPLLKCPNPIFIDSSCCPVCPSEIRCKHPKTGMLYKKGEKWSNGDLNGCSKCKCVEKSPMKGVIECTKPTCPRLNCPYKVYPRGFCCPICLKTLPDGPFKEADVQYLKAFKSTEVVSSNVSCTDPRTNKIYVEGESWTHNCTNFECTKVGATVFGKLCPYLTCTRRYQMKKKGACCPVCKPQYMPKLICESDGMTLVVPKAFIPYTTPSELMFENSKCIATGNRTHLILKTNYKACGTKRIASSGAFKYTNVAHTQVDKNAIISRVRLIQVPVVCTFKAKASNRYSKRFVLRQPQIASLTKPLEQVTNPMQAFDVYMKVSNADGVKQKLDEPIKFLAGDQVIVDLGGDGLKENNVMVKADYCYATPTKEINNVINYTLIKDGCPKDPTVTFLPTTNNGQKFSFSAIVFANVKTPGFYLHCATVTCSASDPECAKTCPPRVRRSLRNKSKLITREKLAHHKNVMMLSASVSLGE